MKYLVIGGSHAIQFIQSFGRPKLIYPGVSNLFSVNYDEIQFTVAINSQNSPLIEVLNGRHVLNSFFKNVVTDVIFDKVYYLVGGNEHNSRFFTITNENFDFISEFGPDSIIHDRKIIEQIEVLNILQKLTFNMKHELIVFKRNIKSVSSYYISPPPPIPDENYITNHPEIFNFNENKLEDKFFRLKIYKLYINLLNDLVCSLDINFLWPDKNKMDDSGFLLPEYWFGCTHATSNYYTDYI